MAALVCDICGGKLAMGTGGIAVCDSCGMEHTKERMQEKVQEIKGVVRIDNSHMIENYLSMAQNAYDSTNQAEAESYCNKIIEIDPNNYRAWLLKGKSAGWQSTLQNPRFSEAVSGFSKAIVNAPEDERDEIIEETKGEIKNLAAALISLRSDRFEKWPDEDEANGFISDVVSILNAITQYLVQSGNSIPLSEIMAPIAFRINQAVVAAWSGKIIPDYNGDENRPNQYEWREFINRVGYCTDTLEKAISLCDEDDEADIQCYENLIHLHTEAINSCSWDYNITDWGKSWHKEYTLTSQAIQIRRNLISHYQAKIVEIKEKKAAKEKADADERFEKYWEEHADERTKLEAESKTITQQISGLRAEIRRVQGTTEKANLEARVNKLETEKKALSLFKGKEKKALQEQIDALRAELALIAAKVQQAINTINAKITPLSNRQKAIQTELTKPR